jgi:GNAT superfamily N-acetyltransferase
LSETGPVVRTAVAADAPGIAAVHIETWRAAYVGLVPQPILDRLSIERRLAFWSEHLANPGESRTWVAEADGRIVGFAGTALPTADDLPAGTAELEMIYLLPETWHRGVGRALLRAAVDDLAERGFGTAILWVFTANDRARRFYEANGWRADGTAQMLDFDGTPVEEIRYGIDLRAAGDADPPTVEA